MAARWPGVLPSPSAAQASACRLRVASGGVHAPGCCWGCCSARGRPLLRTAAAGRLCRRAHACRPGAGSSSGSSSRASVHRLACCVQLQRDTAHCTRPTHLVQQARAGCRPARAPRIRQRLAHEPWVLCQQAAQLAGLAEGCIPRRLARCGCRRCCRIRAAAPAATPPLLVVALAAALPAAAAAAAAAVALAHAPQKQRRRQQRRARERVRGGSLRA